MTKGSHYLLYSVTVVLCLLGCQSSPPQGPSPQKPTSTSPRSNLPAAGSTLISSLPFHLKTPTSKWPLPKGFSAKQTLLHKGKLLLWRQKELFLWYPDKAPQKLRSFSSLIQQVFAAGDYIAVHTAKGVWLKGPQSWKFYQGKAQQVALSPQGQLLILSTSSQIQGWTPSGAEIPLPWKQGHWKGIFFSPTGLWMGVWSDHRFSLWDTANIQQKLDLPWSPTQHFFFLGQDQELVTVRPQLAKIWNIYREQLRTQLELPEGFEPAHASPCGTLWGSWQKSQWQGWLVTGEKLEKVVTVQTEQPILACHFSQDTYGLWVLTADSLLYFLLHKGPFRENYRKIFHRKITQKLLQLGKKAQAQGQLATAKKYWQRALQYTPSSHEALELLRQAQATQTEKEIVDLEKALQSELLSLAELKELLQRCEQLLLTSKSSDSALSATQERLRSLHRGISLCLEGEQKIAKRQWAKAHECYVQAVQWLPRSRWPRKREEWLWQKVRKQKPQTPPSIAKASSPKPKKDLQKATKPQPSPVTPKRASETPPQKPAIPKNTQKPKNRDKRASSPKTAVASAREHPLQKKPSPKPKEKAPKQPTPAEVLRKCQKLVQKRKWPEAQKLLTDLLSSSPPPALQKKVYHLLGHIYFQQRDWAKALQAWEKTDLTETEQKLYAKALEERGQLKEALQKYIHLKLWQEVKRLLKKIRHPELLWQGYSTLALQGDREALKSRIELAWKLRKTYPQWQKTLEQDLWSLASESPHYLSYLATLYEEQKRSTEGGKKLLQFSRTHRLPSKWRTWLTNKLRQWGFVLYQRQWLPREEVYRRLGWKQHGQSWVPPEEWVLLQALNRQKTAFPSRLQQKFPFLQPRMSCREVVAKLGFWPKQIAFRRGNNVYLLVVYPQKGLRLFFRNQRLFWIDELGDS